MKHMPWTDEDDTVIRCLHGRHPTKTLCAILNRSLFSVEWRISELRKRGSLAPARAFGGGHVQGINPPVPSVRAQHHAAYSVQ